MMGSVFFIPSSFPLVSVAFHPRLEPFSSSVLPVVVLTVHIFKEKKKEKKKHGSVVECHVPVRW